MWNRSRMRLRQAPFVCATLVVAGALVTFGCDSDTPDAPDAPDVPAEPVAVPEPSLPQVSPTANHLPPELDGVRLGMSLEAFKAARETDKMKVSAYHESTTPDLNGKETTEELMAKLDAAEQNAKRVDSPDWPGTQGLYYLEEALQGEAVHKARYTFRDGVLRRVIAYYDSPEAAQAVSTGLGGHPGGPDERRTVPKSGDTPEFETWAYKDRYVARATKEAAKPEDAADAEAADAEPTAFNIGPLRKGSFAPVAKLTFDAKQVGTVEVLEAGKDADEVVAAWKIVGAQDEVHYKGHDGDALVRISARRGEPGYPAAAAEALGQKALQFASPI